MRLPITVFVFIMLSLSAQATPRRRCSNSIHEWWRVLRASNSLYSQTVFARRESAGGRRYEAVKALEKAMEAYSQLPEGIELPDWYFTEQFFTESALLIGWLPPSSQQHLYLELLLKYVGTDSFAEVQSSEFAGFDQTRLWLGDDPEMIFRDKLRVRSHAPTMALLLSRQILGSWESVGQLVLERSTIHRELRRLHWRETFAESHDFLVGILAKIHAALP